MPKAAAGLFWLDVPAFAGENRQGAAGPLYIAALTFFGYEREAA